MKDEELVLILKQMIVIKLKKLVKNKYTLIYNNLIIYEECERQILSETKQSKSN